MYNFGYDVMEYEVDGKLIEFAMWNHPIIDRSKVDFFNPEEFEFYRNFISEGDYVINVGTHLGDEAMMFGILAGTTGKVFGFEANPYVYECFKETCEMNRMIANVVPINKAVTEETRKYTFHYTDQGYCNGGNALSTECGVGGCGHNVPLEVDGINPDEWAVASFTKEEIEKISFIMTDTEGYDLPVLKSMKNLIMTARPIIESEVFTCLTLQEVTDFLEFMEEIDYSLFHMPPALQRALKNVDIKNLPVAPIPLAKASTLFKRRGCDVLCVPNERLT